MPSTSADVGATGVTLPRRARRMTQAREDGPVATAARGRTAEPEEFGQSGYTITTADVTTERDAYGPEGAVGFLRVDIYVPTAEGRYPVVVIAPGCCDTKADFANWGRRLASRGIITIAADRRGLGSVVDDGTASPIASTAMLVTADPRTNQADLLRLLRWAVAQDRMAGSPLAGKVQASRLGLMGHSLGGYHAAFAAARSTRDGPPLAAVVLLDNGRGVPPLSAEDAAASIAAPTAVLASQTDDPTFCEFSLARPTCLLSPRATFAALNGVPKLGVEVIGATHNQFEDPEDIFSHDTDDPGHTRLIERYAMAWLEYWLAGDTSVRPYLGGALAQRDERAGLIHLMSATTVN